MKNLLKQKLDSGANAFGTFVWSVSPYVVECLGYSGLDYVIIDSEHSPIDTESAVNLVRAAQLHGLTPAIRAKDGSRASILKMLDLGAQALIIPNLRTVEEVKTAVDFAKYPGIGRRGFAQCREAGYGFENFASDLNEYFLTSNAQTLLLPMCETVSLLEHIEEVVSLHGVDGVFVGPYDLSLDMGIPGDFSSPVLTAALQKIADACRNAKKYALIYSNSTDAAKQHIGMGFQAPAMGIDTQTIIRAYKNMLAGLNA